MAVMLPNNKFLRLPYKRQIGGGVCENSVIRFRGRTFENPNRFTVRLTCGEDNSDDIPFLFTSQTQRNRFSVTTRDSSAWIQAAEVSYETDYFIPASDFDFTVECSTEAYLIKLGDVEHRYKHKLPFHTIRYLVIDGDINLQDVAINGIPGNEEANRVPVSRTLPEKNHGTRILICGVPVRAKPHRMAIDFTGKKSGNLPFHFNPRFYEKVLVRNTMIANGWGGEERRLSIPFPFAYGVSFELLFAIENDWFSVRLNGNYLCNYKRRDNPREKIVAVAVFGSVVVTRAELL